MEVFKLTFMISKSIIMVQSNRKKAGKNSCLLNFTNAHQNIELSYRLDELYPFLPRYARAEGT